MYDVLIVGGGPAALAAACYAQQKQLSVALVYDQLGGKIGWSESLTVREWEPQPVRYLPSNEHVRLLWDRVVHAAQIVNDTVIQLKAAPQSWDVETEHHGTLQACAVIVATGATPLRLYVPGAQRWVEPGAGYSITTYAHRAKGEQVAVIGSTLRALQGAAELAQTAARVFLVMPDGEYLVTSLGRALRAHPLVEIIMDAEVTEISGINRLEEVVLDYGGQTRRLSVQRVFVDLGLVPNSDIVRGLVGTDSEGFIIVDRDNATTVPGIFAAGDVTTAPGEQVFAAMGDGARAAMSAYKHILTHRITHPVAVGML